MRSDSSWNKAMYKLCVTMSYNYQTYSILRALHGSQAYNFIIRILGSKFKGQAILYDQRQMYEHPHIIISDKTIIDSAHIAGHYVVYNELHLGPCKMSGILHKGTYATNALIVAKDSGPYRSFVGSCD